MSKKIVLNTMTNKYGEEIETLYFEKKGESWYLVEGCEGSADLGLGTCSCNSHPTWTETRVSPGEVIETLAKKIEYLRK